MKIGWSTEIGFDCCISFNGKQIQIKIQEEINLMKKITLHTFYEQFAILSFIEAVICRLYSDIQKLLAWTKTVTPIFIINQFQNKIALNTHTFEPPYRYNASYTLFFILNTHQPRVYLL